MFLVAPRMACMCSWLPWEWHVCVPGCLENDMYVRVLWNVMDYLTLQTISRSAFPSPDISRYQLFAGRFFWVFTKIFQLPRWQKSIQLLHNLLTWFIKRYIKSSTFMRYEDGAFWGTRRSVMIEMHPGITCDGRKQIGAIIPLFIIKPSDGC